MISFNLVNVNGDDYGSADYTEIAINMSQVKKGVSEGRSSKKTITGTFIHEIGHNLGLDHGDKTNIMSQMDGVEFQNSIFGNSSAETNGSQPMRSFTYPKVDSKGIKIMLQRVNNPRTKGLGIIKTK